MSRKTDSVAKEKVNFTSESGVKGRPSHKLQSGKNYSKNRIFRIHWETYKANGDWKHEVRKSASHVSIFQCWPDHGLVYVLASLPMRSGRVTATAVASTLFKGMGLHK